MIKKSMIVLFISISFIACFSGDLDIKVNFQQINGLDEGARVLFENNHIGNVSCIAYTKNETYQIDLTIWKNFKNSVTENSKFFIITDSKKQDAKALKMILAKKGGTLVKSGTIFKGVTEKDAIFNLFLDDAKQGINALTDQFEKFTKSLQEIPESDTYKNLEEDLNQIIEQMKNSSQAVRDKIVEDIIPQIKKEIKALREKLEEQGREDEIKPLETKMKEVANL